MMSIIEMNHSKVQFSGVSDYAGKVLSYTRLGLEIDVIQ